MTDIVEIARKRDDRIRTHWEGCEEQHTECLIAKMADEIERYRAATPCYAALWDETDRRVSAEKEIERLRSVLEEIAKGTAATWISDRVHEALGDRL